MVQSCILMAQSIPNHHQSGWDLGTNLHVCYMQPSQSVAVSLTGIDQAVEGSAYAFKDGSPFVGNVQNRTDATNW